MQCANGSNGSGGAAPPYVSIIIAALAVSAAAHRITEVQFSPHQAAGLFAMWEAAGHGSAPHQKPLPKQCLAKRSGCSCSKTTLERMNLATTDSHPRKSGSRSSTGSLLHPFSTPRSPQTPSLPDADPRSDRFWCGGHESNFLAVKKIQFYGVVQLLR